MTTFRDTFASEWIKLVSVRGTRISLFLSVALAVVVSGLVAWGVGSSYDGWKPEDKATFEPIGTSLVGTIITAIFLIVIGVKIVTNEYGSGMMRLTMTATPRRGRLLLAKFALVAVLTLVVGVVANVLTFLVGQAVLSGYDVPTAGLFDSDSVRSVFAGGAINVLLPLMGAALGVMLRSTAGAITTVLGLIFVPGIFGALLPDWWQENVLVALPVAASDAVTIAHLDEGDYVAPGLGVVLVVAWIAAFAAAAQTVLVRRDV
jgi:ABC-2 type transport system permease protein